MCYAKVKRSRLVTGFCIASRVAAEGKGVNQRGQASWIDRMRISEQLSILRGENMPRSPRTDEAGGLIHALNHGNLRATIFHKQEDYVAFGEILYETLEIHKVELHCYLLMPIHSRIISYPRLNDIELIKISGIRNAPK